MRNKPNLQHSVADTLELSAFITFAKLLTPYFCAVALPSSDMNNTPHFPISREAFRIPEGLS